MKTFRLFSALLVVALLTPSAFPQESSEVTALLAKARRGNGVAQYNLGLAYAEGKGVATDPVEAFVWFSLARENGARGRALDNLMGTLDKNALDLAQQRLTERKAEFGVRTPTPVTVRTTTKSAPAETAQPAQPATEESLAKVQAERDALRAERARLIGASAEHEKTARTATAANQALQDQAKAAETKATELARATDTAKGELARAKLALTAAQKNPKPAAYPDLSGRVAELEAQLAASIAAPQPTPDTAALDQKTRELQAAVAELETARKFGQQVESTLNQITDQKAALASSLHAAEAARDGYAKEFAATKSLLTELKSAPATAPTYPDLSGKVAELEAALVVAKTAQPAYPDLRDRVKQMEEGEETLRQSYDSIGQNMERQLRAANEALVAKSAEADHAKQEVAALTKAKEETREPVAPAYPDLFSKVAQLETQLATSEKSLAALSAESASAKQEVAALTKAMANKPAAPAYPDLRSSVAELEAKVASLTAESTRSQEQTAAQAQSSEASFRIASRELDATKAALANMSSEAVSAKQEVAVLMKAKEEAQAALSAKPISPSFPDLRERVAALEHELTAARAAAPAYPDLSGQVTELESQLAKAREPVAPAYPDLSGKVAQLESTLAALSAESASAKLEVAALTKAKADQPAAPAYPDLSGKVAELQAQLAQVQSAAPAYPNLTAKVTELETSLANLTQKAAASELARAETAKQFEDYKSATATAQRERTTLLASVKMLESDKVSLRRQTESAGTEATQLRTQVASLKEQLSTLSSVADHAKQEVATLTKAKEDKPAAPSAPAYPNLSGRVAELEAALAAKPAAPAYPDLSGRVTELEHELAAVRAAAPTHPDLSGRVSELETQLAHVSAEAASAKQEVVALTNAKAEAKPTAPAYADLSGRVAELEAALTTASTSLAQTQAALAAKPAAPAYPDLSGKVAELSATNDKLAQENTELVTASKAAPAFPDLRGRVANLEADLTTAKQLLAAKSAEPVYPDLSGKVAELETALRDSTRQLASASTEADRAKREIAALSKTKPEARPATPAYPDFSSRVMELTSEVASLRTDHEALQKSLATAERQSGELAASTSRVAELEAALANLSAEATRAKQEVAALTKAKEEAREPVAAVAPAYPDLSGKVAELETALADSARKQVAADTAQGELLQQLAAAKETTKTAGSTDAQLHRERDELTARVTSLSSEVAQLRDDRERMQKMLGDAGRKLRDTSADASRIKELETQAAGLQASLMAAQSQTGELQAALAAKPAAPAYPDLSGRVTELESQLAALSSEATRAKQEVAALSKAKEDKPTGPSYPDLSGRVAQLESQLATASNRRAVTPAYPDLRARVAELEASLAQAASQPAPVAAAPAADTSAVEKKLAETEDRLATALRGYALLEKDRDALQAKSGQATEALSSEKNSLATQVATLTAQVEQLKSASSTQAATAQAEATRLSESLAALQRSTGQTAGDAAAAKALVQQLQGANTVLAQENYQLKTVLARNTGGPAPASPATTLVSPPAARMHVVASGDSLSKISLRYYGTANRWQEIYNANTGKLGPNGVLRVGTELRIP